MDQLPDHSPGQGACLAFGTALRAKLVDWARDAIPYEACGLLVGESAAEGAGGRVIRRVTLSENMAAGGARDRFVLDPAHWAHVEQEAAEKGLEVLGVWHSHPSERASAAAAAPSPMDAAGAMPGWSNVIVSIDSDSGSCLRSWRTPSNPSAAPGMREEALR